MPALKATVILTLTILLFHSPLLEAADRSVAGRLVFDVSNFVCEQQCLVTLVAFGGRPMETVSADLSGRFSFTLIPRGPFSVRVEIEGFDGVTQSYREYEPGFALDVQIPLRRKQAETVTGGPAVVNVSEFLDLYPKKAVSLFEKGISSLKNKKNAEAVKYLREAVELAPTFYEAHNQLGVAYREAGRFQDAEREFWMAHQLNATGEQPLLHLTALYLDENRPDQAVDAGEQAVKVNGRSASAFLGLGVALYKASQLDRAEAALRRALDLAPKMATVRLALANVYLRLRQYDRSLEQLNSYIAENPKERQLADALRMRDQLLEAGATGRP